MSQAVCIVYLLSTLIGDCCVCSCRSRRLMFTSLSFPRLCSLLRRPDKCSCGSRLIMECIAFFDANARFAAGSVFVIPSPLH